jgi:hypothetical protein
MIGVVDAKPGGQGKVVQWLTVTREPLFLLEVRRILGGLELESFFAALCAHRGWKPQARAVFALLGFPVAVWCLCQVFSPASLTAYGQSLAHVGCWFAL